MVSLAQRGPGQQAVAAGGLDAMKESTVEEKERWK